MIMVYFSSIFALFFIYFSSIFILLLFDFWSRHSLLHKLFPPSRVLEWEWDSKSGAMTEREVNIYTIIYMYVCIIFVISFFIFVIFFFVVVFCIFMRMAPFYDRFFCYLQFVFDVYATPAKLCKFPLLATAAATATPPSPYYIFAGVSRIRTVCLKSLSFCFVFVSLFCYFFFCFCFCFVVTAAGRAFQINSVEKLPPRAFFGISTASQRYAISRH